MNCDNNNSNNNYNNNNTNYNTNDIIYAGAAVATEMIGVKAGKKSNNKEPWWRRRLEQRVKGLNRDLGRINS